MLLKSLKVASVVSGPHPTRGNCGQLVSRVMEPGAFPAGDLPPRLSQLRNSSLLQGVRLLVLFACYLRVRKQFLVDSRGKVSSSTRTVTFMIRENITCQS